MAPPPSRSRSGARGPSRLAARGWTRDGGDLYETLARLDGEGCARYVVTDVNKDGMLQGPNLDLLRDVCAATDRPVVASGGVTTLADIEALMGLVPEGVSGVGAIPLFILELVSNLMRLLSLSVRLFANILAGHLIILFMSGGLAVLLGLEALGVFLLPAGVALFIFELGLVASLQAFIFATLSAIYLGGAVAEHH